MGLEDWEQRLGRWAVRASAEQVTLPAPADCLESIEQSAMACEFEVLLNQGQYPQGIEQARDALRVVHALEDQLSVYRSTSDFSTINRFGHLRAVAARVDVCQLLALASQVSEQTGGAFDITAGALSEAWGFSRRQGRKPNDDELADVLSKVGAHLVEVDQAARTVRLHREGVKLNPGGIGKGYALDRVASSLVEGGLQDFLVHGGRSSVLAQAAGGTRTMSKRCWPIAARGPRLSPSNINHTLNQKINHTLIQKINQNYSPVGGSRWLILCAGRRSWARFACAIKLWAPAGPANSSFITKECVTVMSSIRELAGPRKACSVRLRSAAVARWPMRWLRRSW